MKNYFYSTLRRQLRKLLRNIKGDQAAEPEEVSIKYMRELLKENKIAYDDLDNENIKDLLIYLDKNEAVNLLTPETETSPKASPSPRPVSKYAL